MKKIFCIAVIMGFINYASAQNVFPTAAGTSVGIGTTNPTTGKLVINTGVAAPASALDIRNSIGGAGNNAAITWGGGTYGFIDFDNNSAQGIRYSGLGPLVFGSNTNAAYGLSTFAEAMRITAAGNVGIGTATPLTKLHVKEMNATAGFSNITVENAGALGYEAGINFKAGYNSSSTLSGRIYTVFDGGTTSANARLTLQSLVSGGVYDNTLTVRYGSVGIGTTAPPNGYKLAVNGNIIATAVTVKVYNDWPDYIFHENYRLPTLSEIKNYIDQNHHLPDMPSEKEVMNNGLNLGEMNKILTKKVEELTLYLIEKEQELKRQQVDINLLKEKIDEILNADKKAIANN